MDAISANAAVAPEVRGQALVSFAVVLPLVLIPVVAYAVEASLVATRQAALAETAAAAVEDAAQQVDEASFRAGGKLAVDPAQARRVAEAAIEARDPAATLVTFRCVGDSVALIVEEAVPLRLAFWSGSAVAHVRAAAGAHLAVGYASPSSRLALPFSSFAITSSEMSRVANSSRQRVGEMNG